MIGRTNAGGGAGGGLNFKVVGGTSAPSNPKENTIWVTNPNLLDFNAWANNISVHNGTKSVSGNSVTFSANASDCYTDFTASSQAKIPCTSGKTYIMQWDHSGGDGEVYLFPNASVEKLVMTGARAGKIECTATEGVTFFTFRVGVSAANTTATYSNIRIMEKPAEITSWHFGTDEPNVYDIKTISVEDPHYLICPHKLSEGDIVNFTLPATVTGTYEALRIYDGYKYWYVRNADGTALSAWPSAGTKMGVLITEANYPVGGWGATGEGSAFVYSWGSYYHREGTVWIQTGATSPVAFNALKKNAIQVYPLSAKQYVSGAWVDKTAQIYQNGAWVDWYNGELYKGGNQYENITGGWKKSALEWSGLPTNGSISYGEYLTVKANAGGYYDATTVNALDLTEYSQLLFDIAPDSATDEQLIVVHQRTSGIIWNGTPAWIAASNNGVLPLTGISGLYYISVLAMNNKTIKVGNIRLVK